MATSEIFNANSGGDVIFRSSDDVLFFIHKNALGYCSGGFPDGDAVTVDPEPVPLTESSEVLEILFQFIYPRRQPGLDDMDFSLFLAVAEAAEKYEVYFAMNICQLRMKEYLPAEATSIFGFAGKHDYPYLIAAASPLLIGKSLTEMVHILPIHLFVPWALYQQQWSICLNQSVCILTLDYNCQNRSGCHQVVKNIQNSLCENMARLLEIEAVFEGKNLCRYCQNALWKQGIRQHVDVVPNFLTFWKDYNNKARKLT